MLTKDIFVKGLNTVTEENLKTYLIFVQQYFDKIDEYFVKVQEAKSVILSQKPNTNDLETVEALIKDESKSYEMSKLLKDYDKAEQLKKELESIKIDFRRLEANILTNLEYFDLKSNYHLYGCLKEVERDYEKLEMLLTKVDKFVAESHNYHF